MTEAVINLTLCIPRQNLPVPRVGTRTRSFFRRRDTPYTINGPGVEAEERARHSMPNLWPGKHSFMVPVSLADFSALN